MVKLKTIKAQKRKDGKSKGKAGKKRKGKKKRKKGRKAHAPVNWRITALYGLDKSCDQITADIKMLVNKYRQADPIHAIKIGLILDLQNFIDRRYKGSTIYLIGSSATRMAFDWSDVDATLIFSKESSKRLEGDSTGCVVRLIQSCDCAKDICVERAEDSPHGLLVSFIYVSFLKEFKVHLTVNDYGAIFNTYLLRTYCEIDKRTPHLILAWKLWAQQVGLMCPKSGPLNGHLVTLMGLFYLQAGIETPVLPNLQLSAPQLFNKSPSSLKTWAQLKGHVRLKIKSHNTQGLGELFLGFFEYFHNFAFDQLELHISQSRVVPRVLKDAHYTAKRLIIRDPFNDAICTERVLITLNQINVMKTEFKKAFEKLQKTPDLKEVIDV